MLPISIFSIEKIEINTATLKKLDDITGIGPVMAQRIIDARPFLAIDDLLKIKGIGEKTLQKIKEQNLAYIKTETEKAIDKTDEPKKEIIAEAAIKYPSGVIINEILPNPRGPDETKEWIEIYNQNNFEINLSKWTLRDKSGSIKKYSILDGTKISAHGFLVFKRPETKIIMNNKTDKILLLDPNNKIVSSVSFTLAPLGQSYNNIKSNWLWSLNPTAGKANNILTPSKNLPKRKDSAKNNNTNKVVAAISQFSNINQNNELLSQKSKTKNPWFLFFTALVITIISSLIVLFIKLKIFKKHVRT